MNVSELLADTTVPMLGQTVKTLGYVVMPLVQCQCGRSEPMHLIGQFTGGLWQALPSRCPSCQNVYQIQAMDVDARGLLRFALAMGRPVEA